MELAGALSRSRAVVPARRDFRATSRQCSFEDAICTVEVVGTTGRETMAVLGLETLGWRIRDIERNNVYSTVYGDLVVVIAERRRGVSLTVLYVEPGMPLSPFFPGP